ncbi:MULTISPECIES: hypothetical protein [Pseudoalteromonas]|uniref:Uncharacterized protein n=1 Tax=Pseudoalteromonas piscicida TaxID=43662 RepID=A0AAD0W3Z0_PSEO7|nr:MULTISPECIES: hypothetical protein [Pseudoalteromonas]ASD67719.1 hypothetical protein B1L02_12275 [Pseudoalteromonas piscicida]AXR01578.1 hypothetical protein D0511_05455 [Pseudoalteromonas piscicida]NSY36538.1 hypothetical protein [Pseudoalteromonas sp. JC28]
MFEIKDDFLAAGQLLETALSAVPGIRHVKALDDLAEIDKTNHTPSLFYLYYGEQLKESAYAGANTLLTQTWLVILAERKASKTAGKNIAATIRAIAGKMTGDAGPWQRVNTPIKPRYTSGHAFYPLAFTCQMKFKGALT